jgi:aryl-alcohol dehydrogenase-like predicted oxidoreductase
VLDELGIGATLYGVFSRGLLTGTKPKGQNDYRAYLPRFTGENAARNADVVGRFAAFAKDRGMTTAQLAMAWVLAKRPSFVPVPGVKNEAQLSDILAVMDRPLAAADVSALEAIVPEGAFAGSRYGEEQMKHLDSER